MIRIDCRHFEDYFAFKLWRRCDGMHCDGMHCDIRLDDMSLLQNELTKWQLIASRLKQFVSAAAVEANEARQGSCLETRLSRIFEYASQMFLRSKIEKEILLVVKSSSSAMLHWNNVAVLSATATPPNTLINVRTKRENRKLRWTL